MTDIFNIEEIFIYMLNKIGEGSTYKSVLFTCKRWYRLAYSESRVDGFSNHLWTLYKLYPGKFMVEYKLYVNPQTSYDQIMNLESGNHFTRIVENPNVPYEVYLYNLRFYVSEWMLRDKRSTIEILVKFGYDKTIWCYWNRISANPNLTWVYIEENIEENWNWYELSQHPNITWDLIRSRPDLPWVWGRIASNPNITWDIIKNHSRLYMATHRVSINPSITWNIIKANPQYGWKWDLLTMHRNTTLDIIQSQIDSGLNLDSNLLSANPNLTWRFVRDHPQISWNWAEITSNTFNRNNPYRTDFW